MKWRLIRTYVPELYKPTVISLLSYYSLLLLLTVDVYNTHVTQAPILIN